MKKTIKVLVILFVQLYLLSIPGMAFSADSLTPEQKAIKNTAKAFYYRGTAINYDSIAMTFEGKSGAKAKSRDNRIINKDVTAKEIMQNKSGYMFEPEDATMQNVHFHVCSHFVCNVYYSAFTNSKGEHYFIKGKDDENGIVQITNDFASVGNKSSPYYNPDIVVYDVSIKKGALTESNKKDYLNQIKNVLQPGDIFVYRFASSKNNEEADKGHAMLYVGDDTFYHAGTGKKYDFPSKSDNTIATIIVNKNATQEGGILLEKVLSERARYIIIIRPLNEIKSKGYTISEDAKKRADHSNLVRYKTVAVGNKQGTKGIYDTVNPGGKITYTITLYNKSSSSDYNNIVITDEIPKNTKYIDDESKTKLQWNVNIPAGKNVTISYSVRVNNDKSLIGSSIISDKTIVDGIKLNTIETKINGTLTSAQQKELSGKALDEKNKSYASTQAFINKVYKGIDMDLNLPSASSLLKMFFDDSGTVDASSVSFLRDTVGDSGSKKVYRMKTSFDSKNSFYTNMYVERLFGGIYTSASNTNDDGRNRFYSEGTFTIGDILVLYDDDYKKDTYVANDTAINMYLYIGNGKFATVDGGTVKIIDEVRKKDDKTKSENTPAIIDSLLGQNCFIVLRPSFSTKSNEEKSEDKPKDNNLLNYSVGLDSYDTIAEAYQSITSSNGTIKVEKNTVDDTQLTIDSGKTITIDTNGKTISLNKSIVNSGNLTINGGGVLRSDSIDNNPSTILINNKGTLNVKECTIYHRGHKTENWYAIYGNTGKVNISSGTVKAILPTGDKPPKNGYAISVKKDSVISITGGTVSSSCGSAIFCTSSNSSSSNGTVKISGGAIKSTGTYPAIRLTQSQSGICTTDIIITGGSVVSTQSSGIDNAGSGEITIGKKDGIVYKQSPLIQGYTYGINSNTGFNFYDGIIKGITAEYKGKVNAKEADASLKKETENLESDVYNTVYLESENTVDEKNTYNIIALATEGGSVNPSKATVEEGDSKRFTIEPEQGYEILNVYVDGEEKGKITKYTFENVREYHIISAQFIKVSSPIEEDNNEEDNNIIQPIIPGEDEQNNDFDVEGENEEDYLDEIEKIEDNEIENNIDDNNIVDNTIAFNDVKNTDWFYGAVEYVVKNNLFKGMTETTFGPNISMTRGMLVTVLYRFSNSIETSSSTFSDVPLTSYYSIPISWAYKNGIVNGVGNNNFAPDRPISREDLATIIARYINKYSITINTTNGSQTPFSDDNLISGYARENVYLLQQKGLMTGKNGNRFDPKGNTTRAEVATLLMRMGK